MTKRYLTFLTLSLLTSIAYGIDIATYTTSPAVNTPVVVTVDDLPELSDKPLNEAYRFAETILADVSSPDENNLPLPLRRKLVVDLKDKKATVELSFIPEIEGVYVVAVTYDSKLFLHRVTVGTKPTPGPTPGPSPTPGPVPPLPEGDFKKEIHAAATKVSDRSALAKISAVYSSLTAEAAANPNTWDAALLFNERKQRTTTELTSAQFSAVKDYLASESETIRKANPTTLQAAIKTLRDVVEVLDSFSENK